VKIVVALPDYAPFGAALSACGVNQARAVDARSRSNVEVGFGAPTGGIIANYMARAPLPVVRYLACGLADRYRSGDRCYVRGGSGKGVSGTGTFSAVGGLTDLD
jgi:hypothetical protein